MSMTEMTNFDKRYLHKCSSNLKPWVVPTDIEKFVKRFIHSDILWFQKNKEDKPWKLKNSFMFPEPHFDSKT